jgi:hypothetical protein
MTMSTKQPTTITFTEASSRSRRGRIPAALQAIFLASNGGQEVNEPPRNLGFKVFSRILGGKSKKQVYDIPHKNVQMSSPENDEVSQALRLSFSSEFSSSSCFNSNNSRSSHDPFHFAARIRTSFSTRLLGYRPEAARIHRRAVYNH